MGLQIAIPLSPLPDHVGSTFVPVAVQDNVVKLDAVRAFKVGSGFRRFLQPFQVGRGRREIGVSPSFNDVVTLGDHMVV